MRFGLKRIYFKFGQFCAGLFLWMDPLLYDAVTGVLVAGFVVYHLSGRVLLLPVMLRIVYISQPFFVPKVWCWVLVKG